MTKPLVVVNTDGTLVVGVGGILVSVDPYDVLSGRAAWEQPGGPLLTLEEQDEKGNTIREATVAAEDVPEFVKTLRVAAAQCLAWRTEAEAEAVAAAVRIACEGLGKEPA